MTYPAAASARMNGIVGAESERHPPALDRTQRLRAIVEHDYDRLARYLRALGVPQSDVDDAAQEVLIVVARKISTILPEHEQRFLFYTAVNIAKQHARRRGRRHAREVLDDGERPIEGDPEASPEQLMHSRQRLELLNSLLESVPLEARAVFVLFEIEEQSSAEIAEILQIPVGTVASRLRRAREMFAEAASRHRARLRFGGQP